LLALARRNVNAHDSEFAPVLFFQPIHDGIHCLADHSVVGVKVEHTCTFTGTAGAGADLWQ
jgi:hypothetical protein